MVELHKGKKIVGYKWIFTIKYKADEIIGRYKSRLVDKGFIQTQGIDYQETFAPEAKMNTICILLSLAANLNQPLQQFDVKNAFLYGELEQEVYMDTPLRFGDKAQENKVYKLKKSLYGLKQSPRAWFARFTKSMIKINYHQNQGDHTLFIKQNSSCKLIPLIVYANNIIIIRNDEGEIQSLKTYLSNEFEMKDLRSLKYFLRIEVARSKGGIFISQQKYILDLLRETRMFGCKLVETLIKQNHKFKGKIEDNMVDRNLYQILARKLIYLSHT